MVRCMSQPVAPENVQFFWVGGWPEVVTAPTGDCSASCADAAVFVPMWSPIVKDSSALIGSPSLTPFSTQSEQHATNSSLNGVSTFPPAWFESEQLAPFATPAFPQTDFLVSALPSIEQDVFESEHSGALLEGARKPTDGMQSTRSNALTRRRRQQRAAKKFVERPVAAEAVVPSNLSIPPLSKRWADMAEEEEDEEKYEKEENEEEVCVDSSKAVDAATNQDLLCGKHSQDTANWILSQLAADGAAREAVLAGVHQFALTDQDSCRALQVALENACTKDAVALALGLRGYVQELIASRHGNYVLQKVIEVVPASVFSFIVDELQHIGAAVARHRFGCRILCRLLEHLNEQTCALVDEVLQDADALCRHHFGNYVLQHVLEFGRPDQKHTVACALCWSMPSSVRNKNASRVIEKALAHCCVDDRIALLDAIFAERNGLANLAQHQFGSFVVQAALRLPEEQSCQVVASLLPSLPHLKATRYGRRVADQLNAAIRAV